MINLRRATEADAISLAPRLRMADVSEIKAASGSTPEAALKAGVLESTEAYVIVNLADKPLAIFGVVKDSPFYRVWMLASPEIKCYQMEFLKKSKVVVDWLLLKFGPLGNFVDSRNELHIRWIRWCGFKFPGIARRFKDPKVDFQLFYQGIK